MPWNKPKGTVLLYATSLDPEMNHTYFFTDLYGQTNFMKSAFPPYIVLEEQSYTRVTNGVFRAGVGIDEVETLNYMQWSDQGHGGKTFYAFIDKCEYVNEGCTDIFFHLDVIQTFMFDWKLLDCFVERQHVMNDEIGQWLEPEPVQTGELVLEPAEKLLDLSQMFTIIAVKAQPKTSVYNYIDARVYDGVPTGCTFYCYDALDYAGIDDFFNDDRSPGWRAVIDSVVAMYNIPKEALGVASAGALSTGRRGRTLDITPPNRNMTEGFGGYVPHNNKMWTYPYYFLVCGNGQGSQLPLRYEYFENQIPKLHIDFSIVQPAEAVVRPKSYGTGGNFGFDQVSPYETLTFKGFPMGQWTAGGYDSWAAQNSLPLVTNVLTGVIGATVAGNPAGAIGSVTNALMQDYRASYNSPEIRGSQSSSPASFSHGRINLWASHRRLHRRRAEVVDQFFDMFGYQINRVIKPNLNARPFWTYIKTQNMILGGNVPSEYKKDIQNIFNRGITFWKDARNICDYSRDNRPS